MSKNKIVLLGYNSIGEVEYHLVGMNDQLDELLRHLMDDIGIVRIERYNFEQASVKKSRWENV